MWHCPLDAVQLLTHYCRPYDPPAGLHPLRGGAASFEECRDHPSLERQLKNLPKPLPTFQHFDKSFTIGRGAARAFVAVLLSHLFCRRQGSNFAHRWHRGGATLLRLIFLNKTKGTYVAAVF
jgi:hypothetical protein